MRSGSHSPASSFFDSGGRSYGRCGSAPISVIAPGEAVGAQRLARPQPGQRRPDDDDVAEFGRAHRGNDAIRGVSPNFRY